MPPLLRISKLPRWADAFPEFQQRHSAAARPRVNGRSVATAASSSRKICSARQDECLLGHAHKGRDGPRSLRLRAGLSPHLRLVGLLGAASRGPWQARRRSSSERLAVSKALLDLAAATPPIWTHTILSFSRTRDPLDQAALIPVGTARDAST